MALNYQKCELVSLKGGGDWNEAFVEERLIQDPALLGLGELEFVARQRSQRGGGRLDLLYRNADDDTLYEVEIQLGRTDETHIIRTIEYWDLERRRYPDVAHVAVIIAEEITSRFFNVIALFNQSIPLIAIKMSAVTIGDKTSLIFTKVLDHKPRATESVPGDDYVKSDRSTWEKKATEDKISYIDSLFSGIDIPGIVPSYTQSYIGTRIGSKSTNILTFRPQQRALRINVHVERSEKFDHKLQSLDIEFEFRKFYRISVDWDEANRVRSGLIEVLSTALRINEEPEEFLE